jgi:hypothetical protein
MEFFKNIKCRITVVGLNWLFKVIMNQIDDFLLSQTLHNQVCHNISSRSSSTSYSKCTFQKADLC